MSYPETGFSSRWINEQNTRTLNAFPNRDSNQDSDHINDAKTTPSPTTINLPHAADETLRDWSYSPDGKSIAYYTNKNGSDWRRLRVINAKTQSIQSDNFPDCYANGVSFEGVAWLDNKSFVYAAPTTYRKDIEDGHAPLYKLFKHTVGTDPTQDSIYFDPLRYMPDTADELLFPHIKILPSTGDIFISIAIGTGMEHAVYWADPEQKAPIKLIDANMGTLKDIQQANEDSFYALTTLDAPRGKIIRIDKNNPSSKNWVTLIAEDKCDVICQMGLINEQILITRRRDIAEYVDIYDKDGTFLQNIAVPPMSTLGIQLERPGSHKKAYLLQTSYTTPTRAYLYDQHSRAFSPQIINKTDPADIVVEQAFAQSKDNTRIPLTLIFNRHRVKLDGTDQTIMYGYGGFGYAQRPDYNQEMLDLVNDGFIYVVAHVRGGNEYGRNWHLTATGKNKHISCDDFLACAKFLIQNRYTAAKRLGLTGHSHGGFLVLSCAMQRPELFGGVIASAPVTDFQGMSKTLNGRIACPEFGNMSEKHAQAILSRISPLENIKSGINYPPLLITTGSHDDRVAPWNTYNFIQQMHKASPDTHCHLFVCQNAGHRPPDDAGKRRQLVALRKSFWHKTLRS